MITTLTINDTPRSALRISSASMHLPPAMLQGSRKPGFLIQGGVVTPWYWQGFAIIEGERYVYSEELALSPWEDIYSRPFPVVIALLSSLTKLLEAAAITWFVPDFSLFLVETNGILLLPEDIRELQLGDVTGDTRIKGYERWIRPGMKGERAISYETVSFLYCTLTGTAPLEDHDSREDSYTPVPIGLLVPSIRKEDAVWIDTILTTPPGKESDSLETLREHLHKLTYLPVHPSKREKPAAALTPFLEKQAKRAARKRFLRKRGTLLAVVLIIILSAIGVGISGVKKSLEPPATAGFSQEETAVFYYESQNNLDATALGQTLARGVKSPAERIMTNLFVTSKTRQAYEGDDHYMPADEWVAEGKPELLENTMVFGVTGLQLSRIDDDTLLASYSYWLPDIREESDGPVSSQVIEYSIVEEIDLSAKRDYWLITAIRRIREQAVE